MFLNQLLQKKNGWIVVWYISILIFTHMGYEQSRIFFVCENCEDYKGLGLGLGLHPGRGALIVFCFDGYVPHRFPKVGSREQVFLENEGSLE